MQMDQQIQKKLMAEWPLWRTAQYLGYLSGGNQGIYKLADDGGMLDRMLQEQGPNMQPGDPMMLPLPASRSNPGMFADVDPAMALPTIPLMHAKELVFRDPFLDYRQKGQVGAIFNHTGYNTETGLCSISDIAAGALRAGFGLGAGLLAGHVLGKLFSMPEPVTRAMSVTGALAGTLLNTGVVSVA